MKPFALSCWMARKVARSFWRTGSGHTPGFSCTSVRSQKLVELAKVRGFFIIIGRKMSVTVPVSVPVKGSSATPTIWYRTSPMRKVRPTTLGSRAKRRVQ